MASSFNKRADVVVAREMLRQRILKRWTFIEINEENEKWIERRNYF
jgi:hypothetical protein